MPTIQPAARLRQRLVAVESAGRTLREALQAPGAIDVVLARRVPLPRG